MTGLDLQTDRIIEIAVIITDGHLVQIDKGIEYIIHQPKSIMDAYVPPSCLPVWDSWLKV